MLFDPPYCAERGGNRTRPRGPAPTNHGYDVRDAIAGVDDGAGEVTIALDPR